MTTRRAVVPSVERLAAPASGPTPGRVVGPHDVRCRYCGAMPGQPCIDRETKTPRKDGPHGSRENDPNVLRWRAWHGDKSASRLVPPL